MVDITVYSTPMCPYCTQLKEYLEKLEVTFEDFNVAKDRDKAKEMVEKTGQRGVPVTVVEKDGEETVIVGFDRKKLVKTLEV